MTTHVWRIAPALQHFEYLPTPRVVGNQVGKRRDENRGDAKP
jgi:hypothetical protein